MVVKVRDFIRCQRGQGLTEYAMILSIVSICAVATVTLFGHIIIDTFYSMINDSFPGG
jgi:Flp pilus assembly pilin Flp